MSAYEYVTSTITTLKGAIYGSGLYTLLHAGGCWNGAALIPDKGGVFVSPPEGKMIFVLDSAGQELLLNVVDGKITYCEAFDPLSKNVTISWIFDDHQVNYVRCFDEISIYNNDPNNYVKCVSSKGGVFTTEQNDQYFSHKSIYTDNILEWPIHVECKPQPLPSCYRVIKDAADLEANLETITNLSIPKFSLQ
jgi:hypothetical protein